MNLRLEKIELYEIEMPLKALFETSFGATASRRILLVRVHDKSGATGWGECVAMEAPFYNHETVDTARVVITKFVAPLLEKANVSNASEVAAALARIQGNRMAIATVETAVWDLEAKLLNKPLWRHLGGTRGEINCGVSVGLQKSPEILIEKVTRELEAGYQRIKLKIKRGQDIEYVRAVRAKFPDILLSVDANSAYNLESDRELFLKLDECDLLMIEQPLAAGDLVDHAKLQKRLKTSVCLDESITSLKDARDAVALEACRIINVKLGRVGGHREANAIQAFAAENKIPVWCGGMLESGIGRAHNIAMSALDNFVLPGDVSASERYWAQDIIEPPVVVSPAGRIAAPPAPGIGYEVKENLIETFALKQEIIFLAARS